MSRFIDLAGTKIGRLFVLGQAGRNRNNDIVLECVCDCGAVKNVSGRALRNGMTVSCGCNKADKASERMTKHGLSRTPIYDIWSSMKGRCTRPGSKDYARYGGRGISVCSEWQEFMPFYQWAMSNGYLEHLTIDRIDVDGDYESSNCRWLPNCEQSKNRSYCRKIKYIGNEMSMRELSERFGLKYNTVKAYIARGIPIDEIVRKTVTRRPRL